MKQSASSSSLSHLQGALTSQHMQGAKGGGGSKETDLFMCQHSLVIRPLGRERKNNHEVIIQWNTRQAPWSGCV